MDRNIMRVDLYSQQCLFKILDSCCSANRPFQAWFLQLFLQSCKFLLKLNWLDQCLSFVTRPSRSITTCIVEEYVPGIWFLLNNLGLQEKVLDWTYKTLHAFLTQNFKCRCPGWCGSVDWVLACKPMGCWFDSQSGYMLGLQARSPIGDAWEASTDGFIPPSLSPSFPLSLLKNKNLQNHIK